MKVLVTWHERFKSHIKLKFKNQAKFCMQYALFCRPSHDYKLVFEVIKFHKYLIFSFSGFVINALSGLV